MTEGPHACFAEGGDPHALAGPDGQRAAHLLSAARADGARVIAGACRTALLRLAHAGNRRGWEAALRADVFFDDTELAEIADALARGIACADLLGRTRVRRRAEMAERAERAERAEGFAETGGDPFHDFAEPVPPMAPESALAYFRRLVPALGPAVRFGPRLDRHTFTLAVASDQVILDRVKGAIARALAEGPGAVPEVQDVLAAAGVSPKNPQYAEMVVRTNLQDALNQGAQDELADPEMQEAFPAWQYLGVLDSRTGDDHRPKIGRYYPAAAAFSEVRGPRVFNCRCSLAPVHRSQMSGVRVEERW